MQTFSPTHQTNRRAMLLRSRTICQIAVTALIIAIVGALLQVGWILARLDLGAEQGLFSLQEIAELALFCFVHGGCALAIFYIFCEFTCVSILHLKAILWQTSILPYLFELCMCLLVLVLQGGVYAVFIGIYFGVEPSKALGLGVFISVIFGAFAYKSEAAFRFATLVLFVVFFLSSNTTGLKRAHILDFKADIATKMNKPLELELAKYGIYEFAKCSDVTASGENAEQICLSKNGVVKISSAQVRANFGEFIYVDLGQKDGESMSLKLLAEHTSLRINK